MKTTFIENQHDQNTIDIYYETHDRVDARCFEKQFRTLKSIARTVSNNEMIPTEVIDNMAYLLLIVNENNDNWHKDFRRHLMVGVSFEHAKRIHGLAPTISYDIWKTTLAEFHRRYPGLKMLTTELLKGIVPSSQETDNQQLVADR